MNSMTELEARQQIADRLRRSRAPRLPAPTRRRQSVVRQLRKVADRLEN
jgi:hypothetical protein